MDVRWKIDWVPKCSIRYQDSYPAGEEDRGIPPARNRDVAATSERSVGVGERSVGGHFGDSRIHTAEPNPLLVTPADGASHPPVEENSFNGKT